MYRKPEALAFVRAGLACFLQLLVHRPLLNSAVQFSGAGKLSYHHVDSTSIYARLLVTLVAVALAAPLSDTSPSASPGTSAAAEGWAAAAGLSFACVSGIEYQMPALKKACGVTTSSAVGDSSRPCAGAAAQVKEGHVITSTLLLVAMSHTCSTTPA